jgi:phage/plasmid-associated DNA primase
MFLLTNDRPKLPPTAAFKGRLIFVPFRADFSDSRDMTLETDLAREMPGILWKLIQTAPSVFTHGVSTPGAVLDATADVLDENDIAAPFIEQRLVPDPEAVTTMPEMRDAIQKWLGRWASDGDVDRIIEGVKMKWDYGRKRLKGDKNQTRGFIGVRVVSS